MNTGLLLRAFADDLAKNEENTGDLQAQLYTALRSALVALKEWGVNPLVALSKSTGVPLQAFEALDHGTFEFHPHTLIGGEYPHNAFVNEPEYQAFSFIAAAVDELVNGIKKHGKRANIINAESLVDFPLWKQVCDAFHVEVSKGGQCLPAGEFSTHTVVTTNLRLNGDNVVVCGVLDKQSRLSFRDKQITRNTILVPDYTIGDYISVDACNNVESYVPWIDELLHMYNAVPRHVVLLEPVDA